MSGTTQTEIRGREEDRDSPSRGGNKAAIRWRIKCDARWDTEAQMLSKWKELSWSKNSFAFFHKMLWKNPSGLLANPIKEKLLWTETLGPEAWQQKEENAALTNKVAQRTLSGLGRQLILSSRLLCARTSLWETQRPAMSTGPPGDASSWPENTTPHRMLPWWRLPPVPSWGQNARPSLHFQPILHNQFIGQVH